MGSHALGNRKEYMCTTLVFKLSSNVHYNLHLHMGLHC